jgi:hypothetical protein
MANTYDLIATNILSTTATSVTFASIPSTYTDLILKTSARMSNGGATDAVLDIELNGSTAANYSNTNFRGDGSAVASNRYTTGTGLSYWRFTYSMNGSATTANTFNNTDIYIPRYTTSDYKIASNFSVLENNATGAGISAGAALWQLTSAITQIKISCTSDTFASTSSFYLYGIKNS